MKKPPTKIISCPVNRLQDVSEALGRRVAVNQTPIVKIRVPEARVDEIRRIIKNETENAGKQSQR